MFANRITLFELFGFKIQVDASWLLLAVLIAWSLAVSWFPQAAPGQPPATYWWMAVVGLIGFAASIVAHELAHALIARRYAMPIRGITLFIFGGVAEMEGDPPSARGEFWMAIAGPVMSLLVALLFMVLAALSGGAGGLSPPAVVFSYLGAINLMLAVFNMVPAFPLDGGRVLRAALWGWKGDIIWATRVAAAAGGAFGILLILAGLATAVLGGNLVGGLWWFLIGLFVRAAASGQVRYQETRAALAGQKVGRFMRRDPIAVGPELTLDRLVADYFYRHYHKTFPVTEGGRLAGCIGLDAVKAVDPAAWPQRRVADVMERCGADNTIGSDTDAAEALAQMQRSGRSRLLVVDDGRLVGVLSVRDLMDFLAMRHDLGQGGRSGPPRAQPGKG
jgi:Zn-dependent protease/CBS domain-containing protein